MKPAIRGAIFDMDGVLTDSEPLINAAAIAMFKEKGLVVQPEDFAPFVGTGEDRYIGGVAEKYKFPLDLPAAKHRTYEIYLELVPLRLEVFPGAQDLVRACRGAGLKIAVASSADRIKICANLEKIQLPVQSWDAVVTGEDVVAKKPAPDIFLMAATKLGLAPAECVVIEDAVNGIQAAKAAGMRCVGVAQTFPPERLSAADLVRSTIKEVTVADLAGHASSAPQLPLPPIIQETPSVTQTPPPIQRTPFWGFWATVGFSVAVAAAFLIMQLVVTVVWAAVTAAQNGGRLGRWAPSGLLLAVANCAAAPVAVLLTSFFASLRRSMPVKQYLGFRSVSWKSLAAWGAAVLALGTASDALTLGLHRPLVPEVMQDFYRTAGFLPLFWFVLLVVAPVSEEILFRGFLFEGIRHSKLGPWGAILLCAGSWALIHLQYDAYGIATIFVSGLLLGLSRLRTNSLYTSMLMHFLMNLVATIETAWLGR